MKRYTQKALREMAKNGQAIDLTHFHEYDALPKPYEQIGYSSGIYGCNGKLLKGADGRLYVITTATSALYMF